MLRFRRLLTTPPSHFGNPSNYPAPYGSPGSETVPGSPVANGIPGNSMPPNGPHQQYQPPPYEHFPEQNRNPGSRMLWDVLNFAATLGIAYYAYDNYVARVKLEKVIKQTTAINAKAMQQQQQLFATARQKHLQDMMKVARASHRATFKMGVHIAMLRKQLVDAGVEPVEADKALEEYRRSVQAKSANGVEYLWLDDSSPYKSLMPHVRDYRAGTALERDDPTE